MKLRNMSATVEHVASITLRLENGENLQLENAYVLTSYASAWWRVLQDALLSASAL